MSDITDLADLIEDASSEWWARDFPGDDFPSEADGIAEALLAAGWRDTSAVRRLHYPVEIESSETICHECSYRLPNGQFFGKIVKYPCPTIRALTKEER